MAAGAVGPGAERSGCWRRQGGPRGCSMRRGRCRVRVSSKEATKGAVLISATQDSGRHSSRVLALPIALLRHTQSLPPHPVTFRRSFRPVLPPFSPSTRPAPWPTPRPPALPRPSRQAPTNGLVGPVQRLGCEQGRRWVQTLAISPQPLCHRLGALGRTKRGQRRAAGGSGSACPATTARAVRRPPADRRKLTARLRAHPAQPVLTCCCLALPHPSPASSQYAQELIANAKAIATPGKGILAADESTGTIGKRVRAPCGLSLLPALLAAAASGCGWGLGASGCPRWSAAGCACMHACVARHRPLAAPNWPDFATDFAAPARSSACASILFIQLAHSSRARGQHAALALAPARAPTNRHCSNESRPAPHLTPPLCPDAPPQLASIGCPNEESYRRELREMLFTSPGIENYISGVVREIVDSCLSPAAVVC